MKKLLLCVCLFVFALAVSGCASTPPGYYAELANSIKAGTEAQMEGLNGMMEIVRESKIVSEENMDRLETKTGKVFEAVSIIQTAAVDAGTAYDEKAQEDPVGGAIAAANVVASLFGPEAALIVGGIATAYGAFKRKDAIKATAKTEAVEAKYEAHKIGVNAFMRESDSKAGDALYAKIGDARKMKGVV